MKNSCWNLRKIFQISTQYKLNIRFGENFTFDSTFRNLKREHGCHYVALSFHTPTFHALSPSSQPTVVESILHREFPIRRVFQVLTYFSCSGLGQKVTHKYLSRDTRSHVGVSRVQCTGRRNELINLMVISRAWVPESMGESRARGADSRVEETRRYSFLCDYYIIKIHARSVARYSLAGVKR